MENNNKNINKIIFFDVDGTLFDNDHLEIPISTIQSLKKLKENNIILALATGRPVFLLSPIEPVRDLFDYFVLLNGRYIMDSKNNVLFKEPIKKDIMDKLLTELDSCDIIYGLQGSHDECMYDMSSQAEAIFEKFAMKIPPINRLYHKEKDVYQAWGILDKKSFKRVEQSCPEFILAKWFEETYDILPIDFSKGKGVKILLDYLNISPENAYAFGDADNDIEMMETVKYSVAMNNGSSKVKEKSFYVTTDVDKDGVYNALKHLGLI